MMKRVGRTVRYIVVLLVLCLAFALTVKFYASREKKTYTAPVTPVQVIYPEKRVIKETYVLTGYVESSVMAPVVPFVQGTIKEYYLEEGMDVRKDQVLAVIDTAPYELQLRQAEAAWLVYDSTFRRVEALYSSGAATRQNYEETKAQRDAAKAQYELAQLQLGYAYVSSPVDGTVLIRKGGVGSVATSSDYIALVADLSSLVVNLSIPEKYYDRMVDAKDAIEVNVRRTAGDSTRTASATLVSISPYIDPVTKTFNLCVAISSPDTAFLPGMMVEAEVCYRKKETWSLPQSVRKLDGSMYCVRVGSDGTERAGYMDFKSEISDSSYFSVPQSMKDIPFIIRGQDKVLDGQAVTISGGY